MQISFFNLTREVLKINNPVPDPLLHYSSVWGPLLTVLYNPQHITISNKVIYTCTCTCTCNVHVYTLMSGYYLYVYTIYKQIKIIHVHLDLKIFITLVWQSFYQHFFHIIILPILFV